MISAERNADFAEQRTTRYSTRYTRYVDADSDSRADESEQSLRLSSETHTSDHQ
jgi:hypothetical protein